MAGAAPSGSNCSPLAKRQLALDEAGQDGDACEVPADYLLATDGDAELLLDESGQLFQREWIALRLRLVVNQHLADEPQQPLFDLPAIAAHRAPWPSIQKRAANCIGTLQDSSGPGPRSADDP